MKKSEFEACTTNGVTDVTEIQLGYDGLSIAISRGNDFDWNLTEAQLFQALAAEVEKDGQIVANPYKKWSEIDPSLPDVAINVFGPPPTSGTRDAFVELAMHDGCKTFPAIDALEGDSRNDVCSRMRQDGPFVEAGENDNLIVQRLDADPNALGIFGYSFLYENNDKLKAVKVEGIEPTFDTIADFSYDIARPIFVYIKNAHRGVIRHRVCLGCGARTGRLSGGTRPDAALRRTPQGDAGARFELCQDGSAAVVTGMNSEAAADKPPRPFRF